MLIETLLMLLVISSMTLIPILSIDKMIASAQIDTFFREVTSNITLMQNHAILNSERTDIRFIKSNEGDYIEFEVYGNKNHPVNRKMLVDSPYYEFGTEKYFNFYFKKETGNISSSNKILFHTRNGYYHLTYWLGSGRFEIVPASF